MTFVLSQNFTYSTNLCQPVMVTKGQYTGTYFVTSQVSSGGTYDSPLTTGSGVSGYYSNGACTTSVSTAHFNSNDSASLVYAKLTGSAMSFSSISANSNYPTVNGTTYTTYSASSVGSFSGYAVSTSPNHYYNLCTPVLIVRRDANGAAVVAGASDTVSVTTNFTSATYSDPQCTATTSSVSILTGESAGIIYMKPLISSFAGGTVNVTNGTQTGSYSGITVQP
jgi:hypothetical protein